MKTIKRLLAITLTLTLTLGFSVTTYAGFFTKKQLPPVTEYSYYWDGDDLSLYLKPVEGATQYNLAQLDGNTLYATSNEMFISKKQLEAFKTNNIIHIEVQAQSSKKNVNPSTWSKIDIKTVDWAQVNNYAVATGLSHTYLQMFFNYHRIKNECYDQDGYCCERIVIQNQNAPDDFVDNVANGTVNNLDGKSISDSMDDAAYESAMNGDSLLTMAGKSIAAGAVEAGKEALWGAAKGTAKTYANSKSSNNDTIIVYAFSKEPRNENRSAEVCELMYPVTKNNTPDLQYFKYNPNTGIYSVEVLLDPAFNRKTLLQITQQTVDNQPKWVERCTPTSHYAQYFKTK